MNNTRIRPVSAITTLLKMVDLRKDNTPIAPKGLVIKNNYPKKQFSHICNKTVKSFVYGCFISIFQYCNFSKQKFKYYLNYANILLIGKLILPFIYKLYFLIVIIIVEPWLYFFIFGSSNMLIP